MANINSLMSSSSSSTSNLYGTRNVLSGLASGMDTEAMIENSVSGYKTKITQLEQQQTKYQWKQDAYRGIADKLYELTQKYTSYTSKTNLSSNAFFNNSISTTPLGTNADKVSATGKSSSDIQILAAQAATAASYSVKADSLGLTMPGMSTGNVNVSKNDIMVGQLKGSFTLNYDGQTVDISFDETDLVNATDADGNPISGAQTLKEAIEKKLSEVNINTRSGSMKASDVITVGESGGKITFSENTANSKQGASPYVSYIDSKLASQLGVTEGKLYEGSSTTTYTLSNVTSSLATQQSVTQYLEGRTINVTLDGVNKSFELKGLVETDGQLDMETLKKAFEKGFKDIGANVGVKVAENGNSLEFTPPNSTSTISISAKDDEANALLGMTEGVGNYVSDKTSISTLLGSKFNFSPQNAAKESDSAILTRLNAASPDSDGYYTDTTTGNRYERDATDGGFYRVNAQTPPERLFELKINDKSVYISKNDSLESVLNAINDSDMGVKAAYSKLTGSFSFTTKEVGQSASISFDNDLAKSLFAPQTKGVTLGDVLDASWFNEETGEVNLYVGASTNTKTRLGTFTKDTSVSDFIKAYNAAFGESAGKLFDDTGDAANFDHSSGITISNIQGHYSDTAAHGEKNLRLYKLADAINAVLDERNEKANANNQGKDAQIRALVNGETVNLQRSSNTIDLDGMSVTLKDSFGLQEDGSIATGAATDAEKANAISFTTSGGSEDAIKTIREFVDEYNAAMKQVYEAFSTMPAEKSSSSHTKYEPLTDDDKSGMSEKAIESYETKAKQGILFGDSDLRGLYQQMLNAISPGGSDGAALRNMGIETTYSGGLTQIKLNETKLRETLENDPDKVRDAFTKSKDYGASTNGLMSSIKTALDKYASTSIASPGVLVKKAGSTYSSTSLLSNSVQKQIDSVQTQIEKWQTKMSSKIDYYTRQFTALEKLMNTMNSQSSALAGLMGGY